MRMTTRQPFLIALVCLLSAQTLWAQRVANVRAEAAGDNVNIYYDLLDTQTGQIFTIDLYSSWDNYATALQQVTGDVGENQSGGPGRQIVWKAKEELGVFTGDITFEVRSTMTANPIRITEPTAVSSFKPGKPATIRWLGGMPNSILQLELYKLNQMSRSIGTTSNTRVYNWDVPKEIDGGSDYQVRIYDTSDQGSTSVLSQSFSIKGAGGGNKTVIIAALAAGGGVGILCAVGVICGGKETCEDRGDCPTADLPDPPDPTGFVSSPFKNGGPVGVSIKF